MAIFARHEVFLLFIFHRQFIAQHSRSRKYKKKSLHGNTLERVYIMGFIFQRFLCYFSVLNIDFLGCADINLIRKL